MSIDLSSYGRHQIDDDDIAAVVSVLRGDALTGGPHVDAFETALRERVGAAHAVVCNSGTSALHLAMIALGVGRDDTVFVPAISFAASANAARFVGARVHFVDVDPDTALITPQALDHALEKWQGKTGAGTRPVAVPVHFAGQCVDLVGINEVLGAHDGRVVVDACHAIGASYVARKTEKDVGCAQDAALEAFSFHPVKTVAMGEGGALTTNDERLARRAALHRSHGIVRSMDELHNRSAALCAEGRPNPWYYEMISLGYNFRASDLHCALGVSQLGKLDRAVAQRARLVEHYRRCLEPHADWVRPLPDVSSGRPAWHLMPVLIDFPGIGLDRGKLMRELASRGIGTQVHYIPIYHHPYYREQSSDLALPGAESYYRRTLTLPLFAQMNTEDVERVVTTLASIAGA